MQELQRDDFFIPTFLLKHRMLQSLQNQVYSDDFFIPTFLLKLLPQPETDRRETPSEDFLKGIQGWSEYFPIDDCAE